MSSTAPECTRSTVRIFPNNVLPCPVVHQQNSRTTHGMTQLPFRSSHVPTSIRPSSTQRLAHPKRNSPLTQFLIGSSAISSARNVSGIRAESNSDRSKNARLRARFSHVLHRTNHQPNRTSHACLIASQLLEIHLTCSQQTRKLSLIASFYGCLANHYSPFTPQQPLP